MFEASTSLPNAPFTNDFLLLYYNPYQVWPRRFARDSGIIPVAEVDDPK